MTMLIAIHVLCATTAAAIAAIMLRSWHQTRAAMQLHVGLCFLLLTAVNAIVVLDRLAPPANEWATTRLVASVVAISFLLYGVLIRER